MRHAINFCCECSLVADTVDTLAYIYNQSKERYASVAIIADENLTEDIIKFVLSEFGVTVDYIDFDKIDFDDSYGLIFTIENDGLHFSVEKAMCDDGCYKSFGSVDYIYISSTTDFNFVKYQDFSSCEIDVFSITGECE